MVEKEYARWEYDKKKGIEAMYVEIAHPFATGMKLAVGMLVVQALFILVIALVVGMLSTLIESL